MRLLVLVVMALLSAAAQPPDQKSLMLTKVSLIARWPWSPAPPPLAVSSPRVASASARPCPEDPALSALGVACEDLGSPPSTPDKRLATEPWLDLGDPNDDVVGYTQTADDGPASATECADNAPHSSGNCNRPLAEESDWHLAGGRKTEGIAFWYRECLDDRGSLADAFRSIAARSDVYDECAPIECDSLNPGEADIRSESVGALLALWLNVATERLELSGPLERPGMDGVRTVQEAITKIEAVICDPSPSPADLAGVRDLAKALIDSR